MYQTTYRPPRQPLVATRQPKKHGRGYLFCLALLATAIGIAIPLFNIHVEHVHATEEAVRRQALQAQIQSIMVANPSVDIGIALLDLNAGTMTTFGQTTPFVAASTTKVLTGVFFLRGVQNGTYTLSQPLGIADAGWQLQEMISQSDNDSWALLNDLVGRQSLMEYARGLNLTSYSVADNTIAPADEAHLLAMLYQGKLLNTRYTQLLLSYMQHTNDEDLIPAALPAGATVYHKYGELVDTDDDDAGNFVHDAAIILYQSHRFVLSIYTNRVDMLDITTRAQIFHQITGDIVQYEEQT